ncbi:MAG: PrsW family intramembrane metalloprotease [Pseudopedobacter sp.]|nr:PrsW family intramembrane metalloprotease [Deinococcales bacterium]
MTEPTRTPERASQSTSLPLPLEQLLPVKSWLEVLKLPLMRWTLLFGLAPLAVAFFFSNNIDVNVAARVVGFYFAVLWGYILMNLLGFFNVKARNILVPVIFTPIVGIFLVLLLQQFPGFSQLYQVTDVGFDPLRLIGFVAGVGVLEETVKILPILWLCYIVKEIFTAKEASFYAAVSGLAFGVAESASYLTAYDPETTNFSSGQYVILQFIRLITLPLLHAAFSGLVGYYVGLGISRPRSRRALVIFGVVAVALIHGLYNFFDGWPSLLIAGFAIVAFVGTARRADAELMR